MAAAMKTIAISFFQKRLNFSVPGAILYSLQLLRDRKKDLLCKWPVH